MKKGKEALRSLNLISKQVRSTKLRLRQDIQYLQNFHSAVSDLVIDSVAREPLNDKGQKHLMPIEQDKQREADDKLVDAGKKQEKKIKNKVKKRVISNPVESQDQKDDDLDLFLKARLSNQLN